MYPLREYHSLTNTPVVVWTQDSRETERESRQQNLILALSSFFRIHNLDSHLCARDISLSNIIDKLCQTVLWCARGILTYHPFISLSSTTLRSTFCPFSVSLRTVALTCSLENPRVATFSTTSSSATLLPDGPAGVELTGSACGSILAVGSLLP
jgi:hypothetical protein